MKLNRITRRGVIITTAAGTFAAAALLTGFLRGSKKEEERKVEVGSNEEEIIVPGSAAHNCNGRCLLRAHVRGGVIQKFTTDETPETDPDNPQLRACLRCRAYKHRIYNPGRLLYPLVYAPNEPNAERGDISKFKRVSWRDAMLYIKTRYESLKKQHPDMTILNTMGTGFTANRYQSKHMFLGVINKVMGGTSATWGERSYNAGRYVYETVSGNMYADLQYNPENLMHTKTLLFMGGNVVHSTGATNTVYWLIRAREAGMRIIFIGPIYNKTAEMAHEFIPIRPGTDSALLLAMMHEMLTQGYLNEDLVGNFAVGFFDNPDGTTPPRIDGKASTVVPPGKSLSAYILGDQYRHPKNAAPCTYTMNESSRLYGFKKSFAKPKTPEWAAEITGISAEKIRELTRIYAKEGKPCAIRTSLGIQRQPNGIQNCWLLMAMTLASGNWGLEGTGLTLHRLTAGENNQSPTFAKNTITQGKNPDGELLCHCCIVVDAVRGQGNPAQNSKWTFDAELLSVTRPIKIILNYGGNSINNQYADTFATMDTLKDKRLAGLIICVENLMTPAARWADVVLPGDMHFEREDITDAQNYMIYMNKAIEPMGEIKGNDDIACELGRIFGLMPDEVNTDGKTYAQRIRETWDNAPRSISFEEFKTKGICRVKNNGLGLLSKPRREKGRVDSSNMLDTETGYWEIYSDKIVDRYINRVECKKSGLVHPNVDGDGDPEVLPIPFWIDYLSSYTELFNGAYGKLPPIKDPVKEYPFIVLGQHCLWRVHTLHSSVSVLRELFKRDGKGGLAHDQRGYNATGWRKQGLTGHFTDGYESGSGYEPLWIHPDDAIEYNDGDLVRVTSAHTRQTIIAALHKTPRCLRGVLVLEPGSWFDPVELKDGTRVDRGGCANTLITEMPTRGDRGPAMMLCMVKIEPFDESQFKVGV